MAVTTGFLYAKSSHTYSMTCLAGEEGFGRNVTWIHMIESKEAALFLHGGELVFFTGVLYKGEMWLLDYVKNLQKSEAAGLIVNIGPYIKTIPERVISYCESCGFPLFSIPWDVHLVDITRYLCRFIMEEEKREHQTLQSILSIIMTPDQCRSACRSLEEIGMDINGTFRVFMIHPVGGEPYKDEILALLDSWKTGIPALIYGDAIVCVMAERNGEDAMAKAEGIYQYLLDNGIAVTISIGSAVSPISSVSVSYKQAVAIQTLVSSQGPIVEYDQIGIYKLLLNGTPAEVLKKFYEDTLGPLASYDLTHESTLLNTLEYYISHNCNIKETAAHEVVHRNTILYKMNKIEKIIGMDLTHEDDKLAISMALKIKQLFPEFVQ